MKKVFYYLLFIFVFFVGSNFVNAEECYFKSSDGKLDMVVKDGKAYLLKEYKKTDGFGEDKEIYSSWDIEGKCQSFDYIRFKINYGKNSIELTNNFKVDESNEYKLKKYDFDKNAITCTYSRTNKNEKYIFKSNGSSLVVFKNGKLLDAGGFNNVDYVSEHYLESVSNGECPAMSLALYGQNEYESSYLIFGTHGVEPLTLESESFNEEDKNDLEMECKYYYPAKSIANDLNVGVTLYLQKMSNTGYRYCLERDGSDTNTSQCMNINEENGITIYNQLNQRFYFELDRDEKTFQKFFSFSENKKCPTNDSIKISYWKGQGIYWISTYEKGDDGVADEPIEPIIPDNNIDSDETEDNNKTYSPTECGIFTANVVETLRDIFNLIKIAGPIIALVLGTLDFVKAITSGDADKELKTAFTRFTKRIAAAIILFLLPIILGFLLDVFMKNQPGYDPNNPYCGVVEWDE